MSFSLVPYLATVEAKRLARAEAMTLAAYPIADADESTFSVGAYTVKFHVHGPTCTCPDRHRRFTCKHVLFVLMSYLRIAKHELDTLDSSTVRAAIIRVDDSLTE